jgi:hypothetical protein
MHAILQSISSGYTIAIIAGVAQLVERQLPKLNVESSNLFARFFLSPDSHGNTNPPAQINLDTMPRLRILFRLKAQVAELADALL